MWSIVARRPIKFLVRRASFPSEASHNRDEVNVYKTDDAVLSVAIGEHPFGDHWTPFVSPFFTIASSTALRSKSNVPFELRFSKGIQPFLAHRKIVCLDRPNSLINFVVVNMELWML